MYLVEQRNKWREAYEAGEKPSNHFLCEYRKYRNSELWRASRQSEELFEYIMYLEDNQKIDI